MNAPRVRFYFDFSCPYAYVASTLVEAMAERAGAELDVRPILLGGVFRARSTPQNLSEVLPPAKARHNLADMQRQAALAGVPLRMPSGHPLRTVEALRALLVVGEPYLKLARHFFHAYWAEGEAISEEAVLRRVLAAAGHEPDPILAKIATPQIKAELRARTDEAIEAGVFGVPTFVVEDGKPNGLYWGVDRMAMVEARLREASGVGAPEEGPEGLEAPGRGVDIFFDYSSPFAYLGCHLAEARLGDAARWRPMLLGAVFKSVGTVNVPLFTFHETKRRHASLDLQRQAAAMGAPYQFPTRFPMNTVLALRMTLAADRDAQILDHAEGRRFVHAIFRAYWAEDRDISDPEVLAGIADDCGLDGAALVAAATHQPIKDALRESTGAAIEAGVFGAPSFVVDTPAGPELFWGADRLELAERVARGDDSLAVMGGGPG